MEIEKVVFLGNLLGSLGNLLGSLLVMAAIMQWTYQHGLMHTRGARIGLFCGFVGLAMSLCFMAMGLYFSVGGIL